MESATVIDEIVYLGPRPDPEVDGSKGYLDVYSPRVATAFDDDTLRDEIKVLYACSPDAFANVFEFMLACKAKRRNTNYYMFEVAKKPKKVSELIRTFDKNRHTEYNLVSGEKVPENMSIEKFSKLIRYMAEGVHIFMIMHKRGVGEFETGSEKGRGYKKSLKPHSFQQGDDHALNVSNVFMGTLIDYYRISSSVQSIDAQLSFMRNEQYRIAIYIHMRDVFNAFVRNNTEDGSKITDLFDGAELAKMVMNILLELYNGYD
jgi:hypothetical protein